MKHTTYVGVTITALAIALFAPAPVCEAEVETVMIPMRDGVKLATYIYPPAGDGRCPAILIRTPYGKDSAKGMADEANQRGYVLVIQDFRGRFNSEGQDYPVFSAWLVSHPAAMDLMNGLAYSLGDLSQPSRLSAKSPAA